MCPHALNDMFGNHLSRSCNAERPKFPKSMSQDLWILAETFPIGGKCEIGEAFYFILAAGPPAALAVVLSRIICTFCAAGREGEGLGERQVKINVPVGAEAASPVIHAHTHTRTHFPRN